MRRTIEAVGEEMTWMFLASLEGMTMVDPKRRLGDTSDAKTIADILFIIPEPLVAWWTVYLRLDPKDCSVRGIVRRRSLKSILDSSTNKLMFF